MRYGSQHGSSSVRRQQQTSLISILISSATLAKPRITWEDSLNEELPALGWSVGECLKLIDMGRSSPLWAVSFPRKETLTWGNLDEHKQASMCVSVSLCS